MRDSADGDLAGVLRAQGLNNLDYAAQGGEPGRGRRPSKRLFSAPRLSKSPGRECHMSVRLSHRCRVLICAISATGGLLSLSGCSSDAKPTPAPPLEVSVVEVKPGPVTVYDEYVAQTQAPHTIEIRSQVTGLLERQSFDDGARVKKGEVLYVIDQRPF